MPIKDNISHQMFKVIDVGIAQVGGLWLCKVKNSMVNLTIGACDAQPSVVAFTYKVYYSRH